MVQGRKQVLFIGNSITLHGKGSYWWGEWGMAASAKSLDYVHQTVKLLAEAGVEASFKLTYPAGWEAMGHDRAETLPLLDGFLAEELDIVILQLGENVHDIATLREDFADLVRYVQERSIRAKIVVLGNIWPMGEVEQAKRDVCREMSLPYVSFTDLWNKPEYLCHVGIRVEGDDGSLHEVRHQGVAYHPGDAGHAEMARRLVRVLLEGWAGASEGQAVSPVPALQGLLPGQAVQKALEACSQEMQASGRFSMESFLGRMEPLYEAGGFRRRIADRRPELLVIADVDEADFLCLSPTLRELRRAYAGAHITLICLEKSAHMARRCAYIDDCFCLARSHGLKEFLQAYEAVRALAGKLMGSFFDLALVYGRGIDAYLLAYMCGARERAGYGQGSPFCGRDISSMGAHLLTLSMTGNPQADVIDAGLGLVENFLHVPVYSRSVELWLPTKQVREVVQKIAENSGGSNRARTRYCIMSSGLLSRVTALSCLSRHRSCMVSMKSTRIGGSM